MSHIANQLRSARIPACPTDTPYHTILVRREDFTGRRYTMKHRCPDCGMAVIGDDVDGRPPRCLTCATPLHIRVAQRKAAA